VYESLNEAQRQAVTHRAGPLLVLAGAGSGKTRVITYRLTELLRRGQRPGRILAVTFTNKAAGEMRERTARLLGLPEGEQPLDLWIGTFHAAFARLLRTHAAAAGLPRDFTIFDDADQMALCRQVLKELELDHHGVNPRAVLHAIDQAKNQGVPPEAYRRGDYFSELVGRVYTAYQARLRALGAVDFGDLMLLPLLLCERDPAFAEALSRRFDHVLVDEFQDVNQVQYQLLRRLAARTRELVVVGDDDQAIYGWRGADVRNILRFEHDWPDARVIKLEQNYRSTEVILEAANAVIARNPERHGKRLFTERSGGDLIQVYTAADERQEASYVARALQEMLRDEGRGLSDFAVFYRTNAQSRVLEEALRAHGLPYTVIGSTRFYDRAEIKDILAYLRLCGNPADEVALRRVINVPPRGIGEVTMKKIEDRAREGGVPLWQALSDLLHCEGALGAGPAKKLQAFVQLIEELRQLREDGALDTLVEVLIERTGYVDRLSLDAKSNPESAARIQNVMELLGSIRQLVRETRAQGGELGLPEYLERVSLNSSADTAGRGVSLMTIHAAKGLEFEVVFVTGMEEGLFPSLRAQADEESADIGEERRLCYVALTRARARLILTRAAQRQLFGQTHMSPPSRFLREIPPSSLMVTRVADLAAQGRPRRIALPQPKPEDAPEDDGLRVERLDEGEEAWPQRRPTSLGAQVRAQARAQATQDGELRIEYDEAPQHAQGPFRLGQRVRHHSLGEGVVRGFGGGSGKGQRVMVIFDGAGGEREQSVIARYLEPA
jgi:DNA helicase-2/ATP-dependent DNA helicase PcrA